MESVGRVAIKTNRVLHSQDLKTLQNGKFINVIHWLIIAILLSNYELVSNFCSLCFVQTLILTNHKYYNDKCYEKVYRVH